MGSKKKLILIVDDNPENIKVLGNLLKNNGYEVGASSDGNKAFEFIKNEIPDLILLDVMMPGMNGFEVCEELKSNVQTRHIPVIFLTAKTSTEDIVKGFKVGGVDYVSKPFNSEELLARVNTHIEIRTLRALLPMCGSCKSIRDDKGYWQLVEAYFDKHNIAEFSLTYCDKCAAKLYVDSDWLKSKRKKKE